MSKLIYSMITSLDGYVADESGNFDWAAPDAELHAFINDLERPIGTYLYGRRMYETMRYWEGVAEAQQPHPIERDFASIWRSADKIVYSTSLSDVSSARTRLERNFDAETVRAFKASAGRDISVGGPGLAAHAIRAGLVDEIQLFLVPIVVGGGIRTLPDQVRVTLELLEERSFNAGVVYLHYRIGAVHSAGIGTLGRRRHHQDRSNLPDA